MVQRTNLIVPKKALISVSNKELIKELAIELNKKKVEIYCTRGTATYLAKLDIKAFPIEEYTGFPEILDGRVKTLHPKIFGGILAKKDKPEHNEQLIEHNIVPFDVVCVDLYPVLKVIEEGADMERFIEHIDIGGISLIRASAKAFNYVAVLVEDDSYKKVLNELKELGGISLDTRKELALKAFKHSSNYDLAISRYLAGTTIALKYGENPAQRANYYAVDKNTAYIKNIIKGEISYNNVLDLDGAVELCFGLKYLDYKYVAVIVKHGSPCGVGVSLESLEDAFIKAWDCDPVSSYGGVLALSSEPSTSLLELMKGKFVEVLSAPLYSNEFLTATESRKKLKIVEINSNAVLKKVKTLRSASGAILEQDKDIWWEDLKKDNFDKTFKHVSLREPSSDEKEAIRLAWAVVAVTKSNAIVIATKDRVLGIGGGAVSRIDATNTAIEKASIKLTGKKEALVLASDAFLPFADSVESALKIGITAVVEPGGSIRDEDVIKTCDANKLALVFSGHRHFRH